MDSISILCKRKTVHIENKDQYDETGKSNCQSYLHCSMILFICQEGIGSGSHQETRLHTRFPADAVSIIHYFGDLHKIRDRLAISAASLILTFSLLLLSLNGIFYENVQSCCVYNKAMANTEFAVLHVFHYITFHLICQAFFIKKVWIKALLNKNNDRERDFTGFLTLTIFIFIQAEAVISINEYSRLYPDSCCK